MLYIYSYIFFISTEIYKAKLDLENNKSQKIVQVKPGIDTFMVSGLPVLNANHYISQQ